MISGNNTHSKEFSFFQTKGLNIGNRPDTGELKLDIKATKPLELPPYTIPVVEVPVYDAEDSNYDIHLFASDLPNIPREQARMFIVRSEKTNTDFVTDNESDKPYFVSLVERPEASLGCKGKSPEDALHEFINIWRGNDDNIPKLKDVNEKELPTTFSEAPSV